MRPMPPAIIAGKTKSNISNLGPPNSAERLTTNRFVEVPTLVAIPPTRVAKPMGIKTSEGELLLLEQTPINIGNSKTTTGVLFTNADSMAPKIKVIRKAIPGLLFQIFPRKLPRGTSAPVLTNP